MHLDRGLARKVGAVHKVTRLSGQCEPLDKLPRYQTPPTQIENGRPSQPSSNLLIRSLSLISLYFAILLYTLPFYSTVMEEKQGTRPFEISKKVCKAALNEATDTDQRRYPECQHRRNGTRIREQPRADYNRRWRLTLLRSQTMN